MSVTGSFTSAFSSVFSLVLSGINDLLFLVKCTLRQHCMYVAYLSPSQCNNSNAVSSKPAKMQFTSSYSLTCQYMSIIFIFQVD